MHSVSTTIGDHLSILDFGANEAIGLAEIKTVSSNWGVEASDERRPDRRFWPHDRANRAA